MRDRMPRVTRLVSQSFCFRLIGWLTLVMAMICLTFWAVEGQPRQSTKARVPQEKLNPTAELTAIEGRLAAIEQTLSRTSIDSRLAEILAAVNKLPPPSPLTTILPSVIAALAGLLGVFVGSRGNERLQKARLAQEAALAGAKAQQERELSEKQSKLQIGNAVIDWQLKQLSLLYGPLRALLGQSSGLYHEMNAVLTAAQPDRFRFSSTAGTGPDVGEFQIQASPGNWTRFRTVVHIYHVYGQGLGVEAYFDEIVLIGARIVKIIEEHAGYARPQETDLMSVFAKYLAHFAVLKAVHDAAKAKVSIERSGGSESPVTSPSLQVNLSAAFPEVIQTLINQGFSALTADIEEWRRKAVA